MLHVSSLLSTGEGGSQGNYVASGYSVYEEENEHLQEGLRAKVSALKHVSTPCRKLGILGLGPSHS